MIKVGAATEVEMKEQQAAHRGRSGRPPVRQWKRASSPAAARPLSACHSCGGRADERCWTATKRPVCRSLLQRPGGAHQVRSPSQRRPGRFCDRGKRSSRMSEEQSTYGFRRSTKNVYRRYDGGRYRRSHQGYPLRPAERCFRGVYGADHREPLWLISPSLLLRLLQLRTWAAWAVCIDRRSSLLEPLEFRMECGRSIPNLYPNQRLTGKNEAAVPIGTAAFCCPVNRGARHTPYLLVLERPF